MNGQVEQGIHKMSMNSWNKIDKIVSSVESEENRKWHVALRNQMEMEQRRRLTTSLGNQFPFEGAAAAARLEKIPQTVTDDDGIRKASAFVFTPRPTFCSSFSSSCSLSLGRREDELFVSLNQLKWLNFHRWQTKRPLNYWSTVHSMGRKKTIHPRKWHTNRFATSTHTGLCKY